MTGICSRLDSAILELADLDRPRLVNKGARQIIELNPAMTLGEGEVR